MCLYQVSYAIGVAEPLSIHVDTYGTAKEGVNDKQILAAVKKAFDFRPGVCVCGGGRQGLGSEEPGVCVVVVGGGGESTSSGLDLLQQKCGNCGSSRVGLLLQARYGKGVGFCAGGGTLHCATRRSYVVGTVNRTLGISAAVKKVFDFRPGVCVGVGGGVSSVHEVTTCG